MNKKDKTKKETDEMNDDIDIFDDFEEDISFSKPAAKKEGSITDDLGTDDIDLEEPSPDDFQDEIESDETDAPKKSHTPSKKPASKNKPEPENEDSPNIPDEILNMAPDIQVQLVAVVGKTSISVKDLINYNIGKVIDLNRPLGETVDLVASGKLFARGELVDIDGKLGVKIVKLIR